jgi:acyl-CoA synthetase (AMP-forming)/AMP-acid ligase II
MKIEDLNKFEGTAVIHGDKAYSYLDLSNRIAQFLDSPDIKLLSEKVVILNADYSFDAIAMLLALERLNTVVVPIVNTTEAEIEAKRKACEGQFEIRFEKGFTITKISNEEPKYSRYTEILNAHRSGLVIFSSGSTGDPKVMVHDFRNLLESFIVPKRQKRLRFLLFLLFDHIGGLNTLFGCLSKGSEIVLPNDRTPSAILKLLEIHKVQVFPTSPTFLNMMSQSGDISNYNLRSLKLISYGTERMPEALLERLSKTFPHSRFIQTFGTSETGIVKTVSKNSKSTFFKIEDPDVDFRVIEGELHLKSKLLVPGYKNLTSEKFSSDGWFLTGDLVDIEGEYMRIIGRKTKVINVGGLKVLPSEVENVINQVDGVLDSTVFSKQNSITGEVVCAEIVIGEHFSAKEVKSKIKTRCKRELDSYKVPVKILIEQDVKINYRFKKSR